MKKFNLQLLNNIKLEEELLQKPEVGEQSAPQDGAEMFYSIDGPPPAGVIDETVIKKAQETLGKYKDAKANLEKRIIENERWFKLRHWDVITEGMPGADDLKPASAWLFNSINSKHADAMDNYPEPNILPREQMDVDTAKSLTDVLPLVLEKNGFEEVYSDVWWYKLKSGTGAYGVFWDSELENGLGDITIKKLDVLNIFWEPGITDLQKSRNLFIVDLVDDEILQARYPWAADKLKSKVIDVGKYATEDIIDTEDKSVVVDWYYKSKIDNRTVLHFVKFVGNTLLYATENDPLFAERGLYDHGMYPVFLDTLYPVEGSPCGFGFIDICKEPQMYIDKLDQIIMKNAYQCGKKRYFILDNGGVNEQEYADWSKEFVHVEGSLEERNIREIRVDPLDGFIINHKQMKIDELKETSNNRDFSQGSTASGVTSGAAIQALQEAGNKTSRDMIKGSYRTFSAINYMCIELIRQFYDEQRHFRIEGPNGAFQFITLDNAGLQDQPMQSIPGMMAQEYFRKPIFDIKVKPQKSNPFSRMAQNELAKELYSAGFFNPEMADQSLAALELMDFEGKQTIIDKITQNKIMYEQRMMQQQMMAQQMQAVAGGMR